MAQATSSSSAKPIHRLADGKITLSVFPGNRISLQRIYSHDGKTGYASSFRPEDVKHMKTLLDKFIIWADEQAAQEPPSADGSAEA